MPAHGDRSTCTKCGEEIVFVVTLYGAAWRTVELQGRIPTGQCIGQPFYLGYRPPHVPAPVAAEVTAE